MRPLNRRLLIEVIDNEPQQGAFFIQTEEKLQEFLVARVISYASDCVEDMTDKTVIFHSFGKEEVTLGSDKYVFIGENHLVCVK